MKTLQSLHPILFALYPPLALLATNVGEMDIADSFRALLFSAFLGLVLLFVVRLVVRERTRAALISTALLVLFFSYGHVYDFIRNWAVAGLIIGRHRYLLLLWGLAIAGWSLWVLRKTNRPGDIGSLFGIAGIAVLFVPIITILSYQLSNRGYVVNAPNLPSAGGSQPDSRTEVGRPDIYYIIMDGFGREDVLSDLYAYDNTDFLRTLENMGFYVAKKSTANYSQSAMSLASSLNMVYINDLASEMGRNSKDRRPLYKMISENSVLEYLSGMDYQFLTFETGYIHTTIEDSDVHWAPPNDATLEKFVLFSGWSINEFEGLLLETTAIRVFIDRGLQEQSQDRGGFTVELYQEHRARVLYTLSKLPDIPSMDGNYFVFAHIVSPHPPFVFGLKGQEVPSSRFFSLQDDRCCTLEDYIQGYRDQLSFVSGILEVQIEVILEKSKIPPVIIIQADHGPGAYLGDLPEETNLRERLGILNAILLPQAEHTSLYSEISPVNTFRVVLNDLFGAGYELLPDYSYFSIGDQPYDLVDVTDRVDLD